MNRPPEATDDPSANATGTTTAGRLPAWRIGLTGGLVGIFCCVGPTLLAILGVVSAATAATWANDLFDTWGWAFRLAGLATMIALTVVMLRRRGACSLRGAMAVRRKLALAGGAAVGTYVVLYAATAWLERIAVG